MKKIFSILIAFLLMCQPMVMAATDNGLTFGKKDLYLTEAPISGFPVTVEATLKFSSTLSGRGGVAIGSYTASGIPCFNFEVYNNGVPRFFHVGANTNQVDVQFSNVNLYKGQWVHIAIVTDTVNKKAFCYINGELVQTVSNVAYPTMANITSKLAVGGDQRVGNEQNFKGNIKNIRLYSDMRTAQEIASDYQNATLDKSDLLLAYDMQTNSDGTRPTMLEDLSGNSNHVYHNSHYWTDDVAPLENYAYSMAVVGDTNILSSSYPKEYNIMYDWLIKNKDSKKIKFLFGLGDITADGYAQYALADANFMNMNERIPFSFVRGEKDTVQKFNEVFKYERYSDQISGSFDNTMLNTYRKFDVGQLKYLALSLDVSASNDVIAWANEICEANPDRNIIISTHSYLSSDGSVGQNLWNNLIKLHKNITLVLSGHTQTRDIVMSKKTGVNNNVVTQLLVNPSSIDSLASGAGMVAMLYFSEDGKNVQLRYYSTVQNKYFAGQNQFSFAVNTIESTSASPVREVVDINVSVDNGLSDKIDVNKQYAFTIDTKDGVTFKNGKLSMEVELEERKGIVLAVVYNKDNRMLQCQVYNAKKKLTVDFENISSGNKVKVMWWSSKEDVIPYSIDKWTRIYMVN